MDTARIAELLRPFLASSTDLSFRAGFRPDESAVLSAIQLQDISTYIDLLLRWNARINLTAVRKPEEIVTRHFGESLFAARCLFPKCVGPGLGPGQAEPSLACGQHPTTGDVVDLGSGAGFPGLPIKIWASQLQLTLIESNQKKATFLREVVRSLTLTDVNVFAGRAENFSGVAAVVTVRAVERFERALPIAGRVLTPGGRLALLIGEAQAVQARQLLPDLRWLAPIPIPLSSRRVLMLGVSPTNQVEHASRF